MELENVAKALKDTAYMFMCSYKTAWEQFMHPAITEKFTFDEVMEYINGE
ncbi:hypothetical protein M5X00_31255 [Paenibacillus alvei]|uniref:Uncharacterized protein n=1 Tax=Paenibacillus alvei TaxID=44250 RepID=A0ABT4H0Y9_PAEAL|nr:hypothetical protein [Paenibacillus alvei]MCY9708508.1 hypothetical protein [Paenibacillus alvei]MCY9737987.1 hypothetical protein [Paenibacillus alvei]MCY9758699.1 hypothetical protein [Paenibacillus alvei]MCY9762619.1 hypothetical protein [Paenibacillus alvei]MCY9769632.1 hypothetical protein [Paenibacillus alvei]